MKFLYIITILISFMSIARGEVLSGKYELQKSSVNYLVTYLIKKAEGESAESRGKGECTNSCEFLVAAPIKSFQSKDSNRDTNMLRYTKAEKFPLVVVKVSSKNVLENGVLFADLEIDFGGVKHLYKNISFNAFFKDGILHVEGKLDLLLDQHKIEKPSLMGVEIKEIVPISITADWKKI
jgi:hypothetical protein